MEDKTITFDYLTDSNKIKNIIKIVYTALEERGFNPERQICGYLLSGDPTYITSYSNARGLIQQVDTYDLLQAIIKEYCRKIR